MTRAISICAILVSLTMSALGQAANPQTGTALHPPPHPTPIASTCSSANFPIGKGGSPSCCRQGDDIFQKVTQPNGQLIVGHRQLGHACTMKNPMVHQCVGMGCEYGPCGAAIIETWSGTQAEVFRPTSHPKVCGYEVTRDPGQQIVIDVPEPFTNQWQYPAVTASCPYTACLSYARPAVLFTVTVVVTPNATGQTSIDPGNITLTGAANVTVAHENPNSSITVTATPTGPNAQHTKASFTGACSNTGTDGQTITCSIPSHVPNTAVTVKYQ